MVEVSTMTMKKIKRPICGAIGGEGQANSWYMQGWVDDLIQVEKANRPEIKRKNTTFLRFGLICRSMSPGLAALSFILGSDLFMSTKEENNKIKRGDEHLDH